MKKSSREVRGSEDPGPPVFETSVSKIAVGRPNEKK
jgi:hypothetical protein